MTTNISSNIGPCTSTKAWASDSCEKWCSDVNNTEPFWQVDLARLFYITAIGIESEELKWFNVEYSIDGNDWVQKYQVRHLYLSPFSHTILH